MQLIHKCNVHVLDLKGEKIKIFLKCKFSMYICVSSNHGKVCTLSTILTF